MQANNTERRDPRANRDAPLAPRLSAKPISMWLIALTVAAWIVPPASAQSKLKTYQTRYYVIHTDLDLDGVREAAVRMTAMAEEYHRRTKGFGGKIRRKLPFYLFRKREDYYAAGGPPGSAGVFMGRKLMAVAGEKTTSRTWHIIQHEGFHQFVHAVIRGPMPIWANEGMAEYFGHGIFTGDGFVVGLVPPYRLARLKKQINGNKLKPFREMMTMSNKEWVKQMATGNYDQAWSMIHFLVHAEDGKYRKALSGFINDIGRHMPYLRAWMKNFGRDIEAFEKRWREYWLSQPANPTADLYDKTVVATMTSFFARAFSQRQTFENAEEFFKAAKAGTLKAHKGDWLPPALLTSALGKVKGIGAWSIETTPGRLPRLVCTKAEGKRFVGTFVTKGGRISRVTVEIVAKKQQSNRAAPTTRSSPRPSAIRL